MVTSLIRAKFSNVAVNGLAEILAAGQADIHLGRQIESELVERHEHDCRRSG